MASIIDDPSHPRRAENEQALAHGLRRHFGLFKRRHGARARPFEDLKNGFELVVEDDDDLPVIHPPNLGAQRLHLVEDDTALRARPLAVDRLAQEFRDLAGLAPAQVFVLFNDDAVEAARGDVARALDDRVVAVAGHAYDSRHAPVFPLRGHRADREEGFGVVAVVHEHVARADLVEVRAAGILLAASEAGDRLAYLFAREAARARRGDCRHRVGYLEVGRAVHRRGYRGGLDDVVLVSARALDDAAAAEEEARAAALAVLSKHGVLFAHREVDVTLRHAAD